MWRLLRTGVVGAGPAQACSLSSHCYGAAFGSASGILGDAVEISPSCLSRGAWAKLMPMRVGRSRSFLVRSGLDRFSAAVEALHEVSEVVWLDPEAIQPVHFYVHKEAL